MKHMVYELDNTVAQMRKGFLEYCILLVIAKKKIYSSDILKELKKADLIVVEGTIYPLLSRLKNSGLLEYSWAESKSGPPRKYYKITNTGLEALKNLNQAWGKLSKTVNQLSKK